MRCTPTRRACQYGTPARSRARTPGPGAANRRHSVIGAPLVATLAGICPAHGMSQDGCPLDGQAPALVGGAGVFGFIRTPPSGDSPMIKVRTLPGWVFSRG